MTEDDICGEVLSPEVQAMLLELRQRGRVPLAAVRRAFPDRRPGACRHPADRLQPYTAMSDLCLDCGRIIPK